VNEKVVNVQDVYQIKGNDSIGATLVSLGYGVMYMLRSALSDEEHDKINQRVYLINWITKHYSETEKEKSKDKPLHDHW